MEVVDETKKLLPQVYTDVAQPAAKEVGSVLGRSVKVLLAPIRGFLWGWEKKAKLLPSFNFGRMQNWNSQCCVGNQGYQQYNLCY